MHSTGSTDALAAPYTLATGHVVECLADVLEGPHLQVLLAERFGLTADAAGQAAITVSQVLTVTWHVEGHGQDFRTWIGCMPDVLLKCFVEMAARSERDEFFTGHAVHIGRQVFTELALRLRPF
ncbi:hypothetical protein [Streptomyces rhizosphaerihabitans]|uniref:hypothetical protein n=1 Tax=Streptomyces rhizosphaerihabitans TaxID=1266770 RepID=UPI0021C193CF|nr:hypothetical protein [Streptomyces rhizosphaerihabitans]MCT9003502.1 hypothetical protein [Streptomyces rhizosphaerihabitans]